jgi:hypothetical protein
VDRRRPSLDRLCVVDTTSDLAVAAGHSVDAARWRLVLDGVLGSFGGRFGRVEPRRAAALDAEHYEVAVVLNSLGGLAQDRHDPVAAQKVS